MLHTTKSITARSGLVSHKGLMHSLMKVGKFGNNSATCRQISNHTTAQLARHLKRHQQHRGYIVFNYDQYESLNKEENPKYKISHSSMEPVLEYIKSKQQSSEVNHEAMFLEISPITQSLFGCFIHNTKRGLALGSVDLWHYPNAADFVNQGLQQSEYAARRNAITGLYWGGAKGIIQTNSDLDYSNPELRKTVMNEFGNFVSSLRGVFYASEGFGIQQPNDMAHIFERTRYTTCIPKKFGGSANMGPFYFGKSTISAMEGALHFLELGDLKQKVIAIQNYSKETEALLGMLLREKHVGKVILTEIDPLKVKHVKSLFEKEITDGRLDARLVFEDQDSILHLDVDILYPSSGSVFNSSTIPHIKAKIVFGTSVNQFENEADELALRTGGTVHIPSLLSQANLISANEIYGVIPDKDPEVLKHFSKDYDFSIYNTVKKLLLVSKEKNISPEAAVAELADIAINEPHPFIPNRGKQIIQSLVRDEWHKQL